MIIGTVRPEEARVFDSHQGYHSFHMEETQETFGSFEVFWNPETGGVLRPEYDLMKEMTDADLLPAGWYWWASSPGCLPDSPEPSGPFATSRAALEDADPWNPEFD